MRRVGDNGDVVPRAVAELRADEPSAARFAPVQVNVDDPGPQRNVQNAVVPGIAADQTLPVIRLADVVGLHPESDGDAVVLAQITECDEIVLAVELQCCAAHAFGRQGTGVPARLAGF